MKPTHFMFLAGVTFLATLSDSRMQCNAEAAEAEAPRVSLFSPEGVIKAPRQARASFTEPMVAFGDPRASTDLFEVHCPVAGKARWIDPRNWVYEFEKDVPPSVTCDFKLKAGVKSLQGKEAGGKRDFSFSTGGPAITETRPWAGSDTLEEEPAFALTFDAKVDASALKSHVYLEAEGIAEKIPLEQVRDDAAKKVLDSIHGPRVTAPLAYEVVLQSKRAFPPKSQLTLVWDGGAGAPSSARQEFKFKVRESFTAHFDCERENANSGCVAVSRMSLNFSEELPWSMLKGIQLVGPSGKIWSPALQGEQNEIPEAERRASGVVFKGPFPEKTQFKVVLPAVPLRDASGRALSNASDFPFALQTDAFPPLAKFAAEFGIIESKPEAILPVTLRNLEPSVNVSLGAQDLPWVSAEKFEAQMIHFSGSRIESVIRWLGKVSRQGVLEGRDRSILLPAGAGDMKIESLAVPKPQGAEAFEVVGIPLKSPGFYVVQLQSQILGKHLLSSGRPMYVSTAALVTDLAVHFKQGRESSWVWVTTLSSGSPVADAIVAVRDCRGKLISSGKSDAQGLVRLGELPEESANCQSSQEGGYSAYSSGYFVTAEKDEDFSFVHTSWEKGIESWRFGFPSGSEGDAKIAHTVFDRTLLRVGDTVHMKHFARRHTSAGFSAFKHTLLPQSVEIRHLGTDQAFVLPLVWREGDVAESSWKIPAGAKLGEYSVSLLEKKSQSLSQSMRSGSFRVEEFRVPLMKGTIRGPSDRLIAPRSLAVDVAVAYLAGGAAGGLPAQLRFQQLARPDLSFPDFEGFVFSNGPVHEKAASSEGPGEASGEGPGEGSEGTLEGRDSALSRRSLVLDSSGAAHVDLGELRATEIPGRVAVELEYRDPSGEVQTVSNSLPTFPAKTLIAVRTDSSYSTSSQSPISFRAAAVDLTGKPLSGTPVSIDFFKRVVYSHRKKLIGGFYAYESREEVKKIGHACEGKTDIHGLMICSAVAPIEGNLLLQASALDDLGHQSFANSSIWVYAKEEGWFAQADDDRIDVLPEKKQYEPGEKAVFQVRMPFREATALVTVEREGVIDAFTMPISSKKPWVEVPILPHYAPNVYISVLVVRGRVGGGVGGPQPTALVDLGKPAYKLGIGEVRVGWRAHELKVQVTSDKELYQVREKAEVAVKVTDAQGEPARAGSEVLIAAVDEGLLQLKPNESWKLLDAMMNRRGYEVRTSTAQSQVVGKRHFGLKALPHGGDGGKAPTRELFDTLLFWQARVPVDEHGLAHVTVPLNDSITSFRIAAVASSGLGQFGSGETSIRATRDLMMFAGVPPLAREGDRFPAEFTLHNSTSAALKLDLTAQLKGGLSPVLPPLATEVGPGESKTVRWEIEVPRGIDVLEYDLVARDAISHRVADHLSFKQKVVPLVPVRTFQATLGRLEPQFDLPVEIAKDALPGVGGLRVSLAPTLLSGLESVRDYMRAYPYGCLEQRTSKAVVSGERAAWTQIAKDLPAYLDPDGLARYFPSAQLDGSDVLSSYILSVSQEAGWEIPEASRSSLIRGLQGFVSGTLQRRERGLQTADLPLRKVSAIEALSRFGKAQWSMVTALEAQPDLWPTSTVIEWMMLLARVSDVPAAQEALRQEKITSAVHTLRSRLDLQGTKLGFSTEKQDTLWWMMVSVDENAARLVLAVLGVSDWQTDLPRLARGLVMRQSHGHWDTTPANAWGALALRKFATAFEKEKVDGETVARTTDPSGFAQKVAWKKYPKGTTVDLPWPSQPGSHLQLEHKGTGQPWVTIESRAAIPLKTELFAGYRIKKTVSPVEQKKKGQWGKGDIMRVRVEVDAQADMSWVVLSDPIPGGASILGSGLGGDSALATRAEKRPEGVWPAFEERSFEAYRAYYDFVPKGMWFVEYTVRLNQDGVMGLPPSRVEAMYSPDVFGELPNYRFSVAP